MEEYSTRLHRFLSLFEPKLRGGVHADEVNVKVKGGRDYSWGVIDRESRYKISGPLTLKRSYEDGAKPLFKKLRDECVAYHQE